VGERKGDDLDARDLMCADDDGGEMLEEPPRAPALLLGNAGEDARNA